MQETLAPLNLSGGISVSTASDTNKKIEVGVSVACGYPEYPEITLKRLLDLGVKHVEIFLNTHSETKPEYVRELKKMMDDYGCTCKSVHPFTAAIDTYMLYTPYERRIQDYLEYHRRYFEAMDILGAEYLILHGNQDKGPDEVVIEGYRRLNGVAKEYQKTVLQENVYRCTTGALEQLVAMKNALGDDVSFVLDTKQAIRRGYDPYDFINQLSPNIKHIHFSDHNQESTCTLPGTGDINAPRFIQALKDTGFSGSIMLELYRSSFGTFEELVGAMRYVQQFT